MPDKHEVGGSSPLGPTIEPKLDKNPLKRAQASFLGAEGEEISFSKVVRVHLVLPETKVSINVH